jgi:hypothetical protein
MNGIIDNVRQKHGFPPTLVLECFCRVIRGNDLLIVIPEYSSRGSIPASMSSEKETNYCPLLFTKGGSGRINGSFKYDYVHPYRTSSKLCTCTNNEIPSSSPFV